MISKMKEECRKELAKKLNHPQTSSKSYWSILKTQYNGRKFPLIPPLLINVYQTSGKKQINSMNSFHHNVLQSKVMTP